ncbi:hypothetical protein [Flammeovirga agarivorans]|uniref:Uncharacterized protein n=1 Tax=Flammeovirga agarivorans TaxID=2726742 RepID=A0A7X8XUC5_9BACT|nr:hypothetical protein [Flammeovirga agarivorans]NLR90211.1 hypothetical protein [Flammeovirga agarivorans]
MEKNWSYLLINSIICFVLASFTVKGQELLFEVTVGEVSSVDIDRTGKVYVVDSQGNVTQYIGKEVHRRYSPTTPAEIQIDAWPMLNTTVFSPDWQGIQILGQQLTLQNEYLFDPSLVEYASVATNSTDGGIWLYDQPAFRLKKYYPDQNNIGLDVSLEQIINQPSWNPTWIREYQNNLYVVDEYQGLYVFDLLGNILSEPFYISKCRSIGFTDKEFYWLKGGKLKFKSLYGTEEREINLPDRKVNFVLYDATQKRVYCFIKDTMKAYQLVN